MDADGRKREWQENFRQNPGNFLLFKGFYKNTVFSRKIVTEDPFFPKIQYFFPIFCNFSHFFGIFGFFPKSAGPRNPLGIYKSEVDFSDSGLARFSRKIAKIGQNRQKSAKNAIFSGFWGSGIPGNPQLLAHTIRYAPTWINLTT